MSSEGHDISKDKKIYALIGVSLLVFTWVTVLISKWHFAVVIAVILALIVATFKASLVASVFMHLKSEKKLIYIILILTVFFFLSMKSLFIIGIYDVPQGTQHLNYIYAKPMGASHHAVAAHEPQAEHAAQDAHQEQPASEGGPH